MWVGGGVRHPDVVCGIHLLSGQAGKRGEGILMWNVVFTRYRPSVSDSRAVVAGVVVCLSVGGSVCI